MALATGRWAWWNQYGSVPIETCVRRAREARLDGVIVQWGYAEIEWEPLGLEPMQPLIAEFRRLEPRAEFYACVDTRGNRMWQLSMDCAAATP